MKAGSLFAGAFGFAAVICAIPDPVLAQTKVTLYLDYAVNGYHSPFYVAKDKGWYKDAGLDVTILPGKNTAECIKTVGTGNADFGFPDFGALANAVSEGVPVTAVAAVVHETPAGIVSFADHPVKVPKDLEGKTLAVTSFGATTIMLPALAKIANVDMSKVKTVEYSFGALIPSFLSGKVDATIGYYMGEYLAARDASKNRPVIFLHLSDYGVNTYANGVIVSNKFAAANPAATAAFVKATIKGIEFSLAHPDQAVAATAKYTETPQSMLLEQLELSVDSMSTPSAKKLGLGVMDKAKWDSTQKLQIEFGGQKKMVPDDKLWTNKYTGE